MDTKQFEAFVKLFDGDEDKARKWLDSNVDPLNRDIDEKGLIARAVAKKEATEEEGSVKRGDEETEEPAATEEETEDKKSPAAEKEAEAEAEAEAEDESEAVYEVDEELVNVIAQKVLDQASPELKEALDKFGKDLESLGEQLTEIHAASIRAVKDLGDRMITLERSNEEALEEMLDDLPRNTIRRVEYRPRKDAEGAEDEELSMTEIADQTLEGVK